MRTFAVAGLVVSLCWGVMLSVGVHSAAHRVVAYESALRTGRIRITEASEAPFGYLAWKLFAVSRANAGASMDFAAFLKYVEINRTRVVGKNVEINRTGDRPSLHPSREKQVLPDDYQPRKYPLTNGEWRSFIDGSVVP